MNRRSKGSDEAIRGSRTEKSYGKYKNGIMAVLALLAAILSGSGCRPDAAAHLGVETAGAETAGGAEDPALAEVSTAEQDGVSGETGPASGIQGAPVSVSHGGGRFAEGETGLLKEQESLLLAFMDYYYESLAILAPADPAGFFAEPEGIQAVINRVAWEYQTELRRMQRTDLSLLHFEYELTTLSAEEQEGGELTVLLREYSRQSFACSPGVDSESGGIYHRFALIRTEDGWRLNEHMQWDGMYWSVMQPIFTEEGLKTEEAVRILEERKGQLLERAREDLTLRAGQGQEPGQNDCDHEYDRAAAVAYANQWALGRNGDWPDYSGSGGNCQNFVSQCLLAGGIPMDTTGGAVWKWYGRTPNNRAGASGRSASWTGVTGFLSYVRGNEGGAGMAAAADVPYYSGEPGDVIHMAYEGEDWRHTVIITDVITDDEGNVVDYLICSNTADQRNFPVSAYAFTRQLLIRIEGWNE